jgi:hypothetical protein
MRGAVNAKRDAAPMSTRSLKFIIPVRSISGVVFMLFWSQKLPFFFNRTMILIFEHG